MPGRKFSTTTSAQSINRSMTAAAGVEAAALVRNHRLWEHYLVERVGLPADHVHDTAELLEHLRPSPADGPATDPHGRVIP